MSSHSQRSFSQIRTFAIIACCAVVTACTRSAPLRGNLNSAASPPIIVATVNGRSIPTNLYEMYLKNGQEALGLDPNTDEGRSKLDQLREGIVSDLIDRMLIAEEAERRGLSITAEQMAEAEQRAIAELGGDQKYDSYLASHRMSRDQYREVVRMQVYGQMLRNELNKGLTVSDNEIKAYYKARQHEPRFQRPERVTAAHILIAARPNLIEKQLAQSKNLSGEALASAVREEMAARRRRAEELRTKTAAGVDFAALAREASDDPGTKARGGDLGTFARDSHPRAFDDVAFSLQPGKVSAVVQTEYGFHIIKVSAYERARTETLAEATPEIRSILMEMREAERLAEWLKNARRRASVRINEPFRFGALKNEFASN
ncbi:MAG TPA: peptidylprolyl isomerase [Pyrinomonadaceae bacterium]|nr:peptidylprolyl isomerase [Pyrinomonadaceae bacterium]